MPPPAVETWWADHVCRTTDQRLVEQIERAYRAIETVTGLSDHAWDSPNWRTTERVLHHLCRRGVPYSSDCWGNRPFRTLDERGDVIPVPHLPITLPSLESLVLERGLDPRRAVADLLDRRRSGCGDVMCVHDYFEGLLRPELFSQILGACTRNGIRTCTLHEAAREIDRSGLALPASRLTRYLARFRRRRIPAEPIASPRLDRRRTRVAASQGSIAVRVESGGSCGASITCTG